MSARKAHEVRIELATLRELFRAAEPDPLSGRPYGDAGIDRILSMVRPLPAGPVNATIVLPGIVARFVDEGLVIAGWVALWYPLDVLLYQHWPLTRAQRLDAQLRDMELEFEFVD